MRVHHSGLRILAFSTALLILGACETDRGIDPHERPVAVASTPLPSRNAAPEIRCSGEPDQTQQVVPAAGRKIYCAIDLGSKNAKLQVISIEPGNPTSFEDERLCKTPLGLGAKVFDQKTATARPLANADIADLVAVVRHFEQICAADRGTLVGAEATQWARDATNIAEVVSAVRASTGIEVEVLTAEREGHYGHLAATRGAPGRLSLDPGSNSFQLGWFEKDAAAPRTASVPYGYVRAAAAHYSVSMSDGYAIARGRQAADVTELLDAALGALEPPSSLASLRTAIQQGRLEPVLYVGGQDGALHLTVRALLRGTDDRWVDTKAAYEEQIRREAPRADATYGAVTTVLTPPEFDRFFTDVVKPADFEALRQKPVRDLYGEKALANAGLIDTLIEQLGITSVVLVPQEMPTGFILAKISAR